MKMYRSKSYGINITEHEITRQTDSFIYYLDDCGRERREGKETNWQTWHNTKIEALEHLLKGANDKIDSLNSQLQVARSHKGSIESEINKIIPK